MSGTSRRLHARPVFVDRSGQRRRSVVVVGTALAAGLAASLVVLIIGFMGTSSGHVPGFPGAERPAGPAAKPSATQSPESGGLPSRASSAPKPTPSGASASASSGSKRHYPSHPPKPSKSR